MGHRWLCPVITNVNIWAQKTARFADSIRIAYHIPEVSYAVVEPYKVLEIAALGRHSVQLKDTATPLSHWFKYESNNCIYHCQICRKRKIEMDHKIF